VSVLGYVVIFSRKINTRKAHPRCSYCNLKVRSVARTNHYVVVAKV
jgi:hypothetical protein